MPAAAQRKKDNIANGRTFVFYDHTFETLHATSIKRPLEAPLGITNSNRLTGMTCIYKRNSDCNSTPSVANCNYD